MIRISDTYNSALLAELNEEVQNLHHLLYPSLFKPYDRDDIAEALEEMLSREQFYVYTAYDDERPAGYVLFRIQKGKENAFQYAYTSIYIDQLSVKAKYRNRGIGGRLLKEIVLFAKASQIDLIQLDHWTKNEGARRFFQRNGFRYYNEKMELRVE